MSDVSVALDVTAEVAGSTGVSRYTRELGHALEEAGVHVRRFAIGRAPHPVPSGARRLAVPLRAVHLAWAVARWPRVESLVGRCDVVHSTDLVPPPTRRPLVVTVHDVAALTHPALHPSRAVRLQRVQVHAASRAARVVADSRATADDLAALGVDTSRICVAPLGLSDLGAPVAVPGIGGAPFGLAVGGLHARKGLDVVLQAVAALRAGPGRELRLVFAGPDAGDAARLRSLARDRGIESRVDVLGAVSDGQLAWLYQRASVFLAASWAEGFGLPVLEAMHHGVPVLASDLPVTRELTAGAAVLVPAGVSGRWADALGALMADDEARRDLRTAGRTRAAGFSWSSTASATIAAYREAIACG